MDVESADIESQLHKHPPHTHTQLGSSIFEFIQIYVPGPIPGIALKMFFIGSQVQSFLLWIYFLLLYFINLLSLFGMVDEKVLPYL